jgi:hypothetical protein
MLALWLPQLTLAFALHILLIIGVVWIIWWLIGQGKLPEPFNIVGYIVMAALGIYLLFYLLG